MYGYMDNLAFESLYTQQEIDRAYANLRKDFRDRGIEQILNSEKEKSVLDTLFLVTRKNGIKDDEELRNIWKATRRHYQKTGQELKLIRVEGELYELTKPRVQQEFLHCYAGFFAILIQWFGGAMTTFACDTNAYFLRRAHKKNAIAFFSN